MAGPGLPVVISVWLDNSRDTQCNGVKGYGCSSVLPRSTEVFSLANGCYPISMKRNMLVNVGLSETTKTQIKSFSTN